MQKKCLIFSLFAVIVLEGCNRPAELTPLKGTAIFSFFNKERSADGGRLSDGAVPAFILLSIEDATGNQIETDRKLALLAFGPRFSTQEIELTPGNYVLTKFLVLNSADSVVYATPLEGADLEYYVDDPLPINFSVAQQSNTLVSPQVLAVGDEDTPESFGYLGFEFDIVNRSPVVLMKTHVKIEVGGILYEDVDANFRVNGYDGYDAIQWTKDYKFIGPNDTILEVKNGYHHYSLELTDTWGAKGIHANISAKNMWDGRADGPDPVTYTLTGSREAEKLSSYISSREVDTPGKGIVYQPESRVSYSYKTDGRLEYIYYEMYNSVTSQFEESSTETFTYDGEQVSTIVATLNGKYFKEVNYTYGAQDKITEINLNSGITTTLVITPNDANTNVRVTYTFSNGNSFLYEFDMRFNNIVSDKTINGGQLCNSGIYTFDKNINPFRHLGYNDIHFRNWSLNNKLTEHIDYLACSFPTLIPVSYMYTYDQDGYPIKKITSYKSGWGANDPISPYHSKVDFYYE